MNIKRLAATALAFCVVAAACGGDDDTQSDATDAPDVATSSTMATGDSGAPVATAGDSTMVATSAPGTTDATVPDDVALDPDATLSILTAAPPPGSWDPANTLSPNQDIQFYAYVYDTLLRLAPDNTLEPRLATEWEYDDTQTRLTLTLRDDVVFTDGSPFNAEVAKLNLDRVRTGTGGAARILAGISEVQVVSPTELVIVQPGPNAKVLFSLATTASSMASGQAIADDPSGLAQQPVGSGPYTLESANQSTTAFVRNDDYWGADEAVYAARHELSSATDTNARMNAILSDQVDFVQITNAAPNPDILGRVDDGTLQMVTVATQSSTIGINNNVPPFDNPLVIQAVNHAIDRDLYNENVYLGGCAPSSQVFVDGMLGHIDGLAYDYDVDKAKDLMAQAGVTEATVQYQGVAGAATAPIELLQSMLAEIGITIELTLSPIQEVFPNFFAGEFGMSALALFLTVPDPSYVTDYLTGFLNPGTKDPALVELVNTANAMDVDDPGREAAYQAVNQYVFDHPVLVPLCQTPVYLVSQPDVVGADQIPFRTINALDMTRLGKRAG